ncbi:MAG: homogentisate 1,2-dioxygenase [Flavobacteriales bacterium]|nr:homogentisate 1,2-dioxygenase [Flavobacteriales bacterium]
MPFYSKLGRIPHKRHTVFKKDDGRHHYEQLFGTEGFSGLSSLLYHVNRPTQIKEALDSIDVKPEMVSEKNLKSQRLNGFEFPTVNDYLESRIPVLLNEDCTISLASPRESFRSYFYKNATADEVIFIHQGTGTLRSMMGNLRFSYGDYVVIPRGVIYQIDFDTEENRLLIVESSEPIYTPNRYRNTFGQLLEHSPFCERDIRTPNHLESYDEAGDFLMKIKTQHTIHQFIYATHPFNVVGWDGYNFPYIFSIHDFEPITGRVHMPPPIHQTFQSSGFVICSFCPRIYDYHPEAVPAPYHHSNLNSDEVLYYVAGDFMSRNNIQAGDLTLHPAGIPHGPHPGAMERSIGQKETHELAVMVDTFKPLKMTRIAADLCDERYYKSWV